MRPIYLLLVVCAVVEVLAEGEEDTLDLVILHNNDMHARFEETSRNSGTCKTKTETPERSRTGCVGGFARTAHVIREYRKAAEEGGKPVLYLNAGDTFVGTAWFSAHKWNISVEFMNALSPDAMSLGNHEFDFGVATLAPFVAAANFPIVAANLNFTDEPALQKINKSVILEVQGRQIGVIGHLITDTRVMSSPGAVIFEDVLESVKKEAEILEQSGINIIVVLGHSGYGMDLQIAKEVPQADVVIGGHTNTFLWNGRQPDEEKPEDMYPKVVVQTSGKRVLVVQAYAYTKYLGLLNVSFDTAGDLLHFEGQPIFLDTDVPQDDDILEKLEVYRPAVDALDEKVVGKSSVLLDTTNNKCRRVECNLGNLITDAFVFYMAHQHVGHGWTDTPIALINGGSIRTTIDPAVRGGNITRGELMGTMPFENQIIALSLTGSELLETLELGVKSNGETSKGEFLQFSGVHVVYDMEKPSFSRVVSAKVRCGNCTVPIYEPVDPNKVYRLVTVSFLTNGGDNHYVLKNAKNQKVQDLNDIDVVAGYLNRQSIVYPEEQGRIQFVEKKVDGSGSSASRNLYMPMGVIGALFLHIVHKVLN